MRILFASAECAPFAKSGGLGDVIGALPCFLKNLSHDVRIVMPLYSFIDKEKFRIIESLKGMIVLLGRQRIVCNIYKASIAEDVPVYFIDYPPFYDRAGIYHDHNFKDYDDNPIRFTFLSLGALELCRSLIFKPDIVHAHDWHTALLPAYLKTICRDEPLFDRTAAILTIHNLAYQGRYAAHYYENTGLNWDYYKQDIFEDCNSMNFLKGGIHFADMINTVSNGYADETRTPEGGYGLDYFLKKKGPDYTGILNGVDYSHWDPSKDRLIPSNYSPQNTDGKIKCKINIQKQFHLKQDTGIPLIGIISRLVVQKGFYVLSECIETILRDFNVHFLVLGSGDKALENYFSDLSYRYPGKFGCYIGYSNDLAHKIEAASDFFLMPSIFEPCGLNQIYSLKYGTLPIVRATGGLKETVENYNPETGEGTGFVFNDPTGPAIYGTVKWALDTWFNRRAHIEKLMHNAMKQHFSWDDSAREYVSMYNRAIAKL